MARVKKFELREAGTEGYFNAYVTGKWRGMVKKSGRSDYELHLGKGDVTNFKSKKALETWLTEKWAS